MENRYIIFFLSWLLILFSLISCSNEGDDINNGNSLEPCDVEELGIFYENSGNYIYCVIDSTILTNNKFKIWFKDNTTNRSYKAEFYRHDGSLLESGMHYFLSENDELFYHYLPLIQFAVEDLEASNENTHLVLYDKFEVCVQIDTQNSTYGILIEGMKIFNSELGHDFLTFSLSNQNYSKR
jgi:hypothetical protein